MSTLQFRADDLRPIVEQSIKAKVKLLLVRDDDGVYLTPDFPHAPRVWANRCSPYQSSTFEETATKFVGKQHFRQALLLRSAIKMHIDDGVRLVRLTFKTLDDIRMGKAK